MVDFNSFANTEASFADLELGHIQNSSFTLFSKGSERSGPPAKTKVFRGRVLLNEDVSTLNFYSSWFFTLFLGLVSITYSTLEPQFISQQFQIPDHQMGKTTTWVCLIDYSIRLLFALVYGSMIDYYGRKTVLTIGVVLTSLGYFLIPVTSTSLFPGYLIGKSFLSCGLIGLQMLPFAADYIDNSTKGFMTGINFGIAFIGGGFGAVFLSVLLSFGASYKTIYWSMALLILVMGFVISLGIKGGNTYYKKPKSELEQETKSQTSEWEEVKVAFKTIPWLTYSIIFGILGNANFYILTTGLVIWVKALMPEGGDPTPLAATYQAIFFILSFFLTGAIALKVDKIPHMKLIVPVLVIATFGFVLIPMVASASSVLLYVFFIIEGISLPGIFVFSTYLSIRYNPPEIRGILSGIGNGIGFLGAIIILGVGGFLHDYWRKDASFVLFGVLLAMTLVTVTVMHQVMTKSLEDPKDKSVKKASRAWKSEIEKNA